MSTTSARLRASIRWRHGAAAAVVLAATALLAASCSSGAAPEPPFRSYTTAYSAAAVTGVISLGDLVLSPADLDAIL